MQVTIDIPDELAAEAKAQGVEIGAFVEERLRGTLGKRMMTQEERERGVAAMLEFAEKYKFTTGGQSIKSMIHEGHKY